MDLANLADIVVVALIGALGWQWRVIYGMRMKQVELDVRQQTMRDELDRGTEKFDAMQDELKGIHEELKAIHVAIAGSVWQGVGTLKGDKP